MVNGKCDQRVRGVFFAITILTAAMMLAGCAGMAKKTHYDYYYAGDPVEAERIIAPHAEKAALEDSKQKNLLLWDLGVYQFSQGKYKEAIESFKQSVLDRERLYGTGETVKTVALKSASSSKYLGDPVEVSVAYFYIGLSYFMLDDLENALVAFKRSTEEDLSGEEEKIGDMAVTNYMMGECYVRTHQYDDAIVAYRRALSHADGLLPAYAGVLHSARASKDQSAFEFAEQALKERADAGYVERILENPHRGVTVLLLGEWPDAVAADGWTGAFRKRQEISSKVTDGRTWRITTDHGDSRVLCEADYMHTHFTDQGGFGGEAARQVTKAVVGQGLKKLGFGFLAPKTDADVRSWRTMPGRVRIGYVPTDAGSHTVTVSMTDKKGVEALTARQEFLDVSVPEDGRVLLIVNEFVKNSGAQISKVIH